MDREDIILRFKKFRIRHRFFMNFLPYAVFCIGGAALLKEGLEYKFLMVEKDKVSADDLSLEDKKMVQQEALDNYQKNFGDMVQPDAFKNEEVSTGTPTRARPNF